MTCDKILVGQIELLVVCHKHNISNVFSHIIDPNKYSADDYAHLSLLSFFIHLKNKELHKDILTSFKNKTSSAQVYVWIFCYRRSSAGSGLIRFVPSVMLFLKSHPKLCSQSPSCFLCIVFLSSRFLHLPS